MKYFLFALLLIFSASFIFYYPERALTLAEFSRYSKKHRGLDRVSVRMASTRNKDVALKSQRPATSEQEKRRWQEAHAWISIIRLREKNCKEANNKYFPDEGQMEYKSPAFRDPELITNKLDNVFQNALSRNETLPFFIKMREVAENCSLDQLELYHEIFEQAAICREYESTNFIQNILKAAAYHKYNAGKIESLKLSLLEMSEQLLREQLSLENIIFVLTVLNSNQMYPLGELKVDPTITYKRVFVLWEKYEQEVASIKGDRLCDYFRDYFADVEEISFRVQNYIEELRNSI